MRACPVSLAQAPEVIPLQFQSILVTSAAVIYNLRGSEPRAPKKNLANASTMDWHRMAAQRAVPRGNLKARGGKQNKQPNLLN